MASGGCHRVLSDSLHSKRGPEWQVPPIHLEYGEYDVFNSPHFASFGQPSPGQRVLNLHIYNEVLLVPPSDS